MKKSLERILFATALLLVVVIAALLAWIQPLQPEATPSRIALIALHAPTSANIEAAFAETAYQWPPEDGRVPPLALTSLPDDFSALETSRRKTLFFMILAPLIAAENRDLRDDRAFLLETFQAYPQLPTDSDTYDRVDLIAQRYRVNGNLDDPALRRLLLRKVDEVPAALVLAQAANESAWGTSRFAREANNLFGMWTWDANQGLRPRDRDEDADHFVRVFKTLRAAVRNYLYTLNTSHAYARLRAIRERYRADDSRPDPMKIVDGLSRYSSRGEEYVDDIRTLMHYNALDTLPPLRLRNLDD